MPFNTTPIGFAYADMELNGTNLVNVPTTGADKGVGIGAGVDAQTALQLAGTFPTSSNLTYVTRATGTIPSGTTTTARIFGSEPQTEAAAFTLTSLQHYHAAQGTFGAGSAVTTQVGFLANSSLIGATNNYGFQGSIPEGTNRYNLYMTGTADNVLTGRLGIGGTPNAAYKVRITGTLPSSSNTTWVMNADGTIPSTSTTASITYSSEVGTQAASFTCASLQHFRVNQGAFGAGSSVTNQYGFLVQSTMTGATNNYGFLSDLAAGTGRWNFYAAGTAQNYFAGNTLIATTTQLLNARLTVNQSAGGSDYGIALQDNSSNQAFIGVGGGPGLYFRAGAGNPVGTLNSSGNFINASDIAYKTDINPISYGLDTVLALLPKSYKLIANDKPGIGFIAQEMEKIIPEIVSGEEGSKGISYGQLTAVLVKAIQELSAKVAALEAK